VTATLTCEPLDDTRRRVATLRARAYVGPAPGVVALDDDHRLVVHLPDGTEANARALVEHVLAPGERAAAIVGIDDTTDPAIATTPGRVDDAPRELGFVYEGRDDGGIQRVAAELGDGGDAGSDARAAIARQFGIDALADGTGLRERFEREYGTDHQTADELHFYAQQLAFANDPDTHLDANAIRNDPGPRLRELVDDAADDALTTAFEDADYEWLASLAADRTTRPPVAYEPDDHDVV
jgi:hypothetical protein